MIQRIISMDGGGIRGVLTARLLERLEKAVPGILDATTLFAGTSTGGILAAGLASKYRPEEIVQLYRENANIVFANPWWRAALGVFGLTKSKYPIDGLLKTAEKYFGGKTLADLPHRVLIAAFELDGMQKVSRTMLLRKWKAKFFHNFPGPDSDGSTPVVDAVVATSAAPTFFPPYKGFVDGGVFASNPSMAAYVQVHDSRAVPERPTSVRMLSLGTGTYPEYIENKDSDWGLAQWAPKLPGILIGGVAEVADFQCKQLLGDNYLRVNPFLLKNIEMDAADQVEALIKVADAVDLTSAIDWLKNTYMKSE